MKSLFSIVADPVTSRWNMYQAIKHEFSLIRRGRLAAHSDLDGCFIRPHVVAGHVGKLFYKGGKERIEDKLVDRTNNHGMFAVPLPLELATEQTRELLGKLYPHSEEHKRVREKVIKAAQEMFGPDIPYAHSDKEIMPDHLDLFFVGDYLDCVEEALGLRKEIDISILRGDGQYTLDCIRRLRSVPDYSHHYPDRRPPPPGSDKNRQPEQSRVPAFGQLNPLGS